MSLFDTTFVNNLKDILENGTEYLSRSVWEDGSRAVCKKKVPLVNTYNEDFLNVPPVGTLRKLAIKNCVDEILWIWQRKSNNVHDLHSHIWDSWADKDGLIGKAYGYQVKTALRTITEGNDILLLDQTDYVIHELKYNTFSRRIVTDLFAINDLHEMNLEPCCYGCTWNVVQKNGKLYLNLILNQRSQDMIVANNWNVFQYWVLQNMFALECDIEVGSLTHVITDAHIYDKHIKIAEEMIDRYEKGYVFSTPNITFENWNSFYEFKVDDLKVEDYRYDKVYSKIPVAV